MKQRGLAAQLAQHAAADDSLDCDNFASPPLKIVSVAHAPLSAHISVVERHMLEYLSTHKIPVCVHDNFICFLYFFAFWISSQFIARAKF